jgi:hypothetical protein
MDKISVQAPEGRIRRELAAIKYDPSIPDRSSGHGGCVYELLVSISGSVAAYVVARMLAARWGLDPKPRGALTFSMVIVAGFVTDVLWKAIVHSG